MNTRIGVIGGSGLYDIEGLKWVDEARIDTPFGKPSDTFRIAELDGERVVFLPRHGRGHIYSPSEINYRANIYGMKTLGVERILSVSAVGSMKENIPPGDIILVDQFIDRTMQRPSTFFGNGLVGHVSFANPVCPHLLDVTYTAAKKAEAKVHRGGTYVCIEGPMFSTKAESLLYRSWGVDCIGMTNYQEAKLAREAEICYLTIALSTDYDCWHESEEAVDVSMIVETLKNNIATAKAIIRGTVSQISKHRNCPCANSLQHAFMTDRKSVSPEVIQRLGPIVSKYFG